MKIDQAMAYARRYTLGAIKPLTNQGEAFDALRREVLRLRKDRARLDFLERNHSEVYCDTFDSNSEVWNAAPAQSWHNTARSAIDAAIAETRRKK